MPNDKASDRNDVWVVYDGACPLCGAYVMHYRIRQFATKLHLIDARRPHPLVDEVRRQGFDLDAGMVVKVAGRLYHGADAMNVLAVLGSGSTLFNRLNRVLFQRQGLARVLYPWLAAGRKLVLRVLGRPLIGGAPLTAVEEARDG